MGKHENGTVLIRRSVRLFERGLDQRHWHDRRRRVGAGCGRTVGKPRRKERVTGRAHGRRGARVRIFEAFEFGDDAAEAAVGRKSVGANEALVDARARGDSLLEVKSQGEAQLLFDAGREGLRDGDHERVGDQPKGQELMALCGFLRDGADGIGLRSWEGSGLGGSQAVAVRQDFEESGFLDLTDLEEVGGEVAAIHHLPRQRRFHFRKRRNSAL